MIWNDGLVWCMHRGKEVFSSSLLLLRACSISIGMGGPSSLLPSSDVGVAYTAFSSPMMIMMRVQRC